MIEKEIQKGELIKVENGRIMKIVGGTDVLKDYSSVFSTVCLNLYLKN